MKPTEAPYEQQPRDERAEGYAQDEHRKEERRGKGHEEGVREEERCAERQLGDLLCFVCVFRRRGETREEVGVRGVREYEEESVEGEEGECQWDEGE